MVAATFPGRLAVQQRVLPVYRAPFFDALASACSGGLSVFAGKPRPEEHIVSAERLQTARLVQARNLHLFAITSPFFQCWQVGVVDWLQEWQPDALIVEANPRYLSTRRAVSWMHDRGKPVLGWGLGAPNLSGRLAGWRKSGRERFLHQFDGLIAYSQRGAADYAATGFPAQSIFVARNAVTGKPSAPLPARPPQFDGRPVVLFVGRLQQRKRIDNLLRACAALPEDQQPHCWIVGDGPARDEFESLAQGIYPGTKFFGAKHGPDLDAIFDQADVFVLPGTGGLAVQQAMAHGLPVIVAQGDGTQDDLVRAENGWSILPDNLPQLTHALAQALQNPTRLRQMGAESYRIVSDEINLECMVSVFLEALSTLQPDRFQPGT